MNVELKEKLQKFIKLFIEDMDADHLGSLLVESKLNWEDLQEFLNAHSSVEIELEAKIN